MKREVISTLDGSKTIYIEEMDETYHSSHGAIQEARHVFILNGLEPMLNKNLKIFELGFGTGLNAILTSEFAKENDKVIEYHGVEAFPVELSMALEMGYTVMIGNSSTIDFEQLHKCTWDKLENITPQFSLKKIKSKIQDLKLPKEYFDLIYYDAFGPRAQSEMWEIDVLLKIHDSLKDQGVLVTYCAQGQFKRNLKALGFTVQSLPGPPGKREMTRAIKNQCFF